MNPQLETIDHIHVIVSDRQKALDWYNSKDYARIKDIRHKYADSNLVILKGLI